MMIPIMGTRPFRRILNGDLASKKILEVHGNPRIADSSAACRHAGDDALSMTLPLKEAGATPYGCTGIGG